MSSLDGFSSVIKEIWSIFTYYSLHGNAADPSRLNSHQFLKFCKDSQLCEKKMVAVPVDQAKITVVYRGNHN